MCVYARGCAHTHDRIHNKKDKKLEHLSAQIHTRARAHTHAHTHTHTHTHNCCYEQIAPTFMKPSALCSQTEQVTFQVALISDGTQSFGLVYYKTGAMNWVYRPETALIVGQSKGDGSTPEQEIVSNTSTAFTQMDTYSGNTGMYSAMYQRWKHSTAVQG